MGEGSVKSFWQRPEGVTGALFLVLLLGGLGFGVVALLPIILVLVQSAFYAMLFGLGFIALLYVALDPKMHALLGYMYKVAMRKITGLFILIDPIAICESYIQDLIKSRDLMSEHIQNLKGKQQSLRRVISDNDAKTLNCMQLAEQARKQGDQEMQVSKGRQAMALEKSNATLKGLDAKIDLLISVLEGMYKRSKSIIENTQFEVDVQKRESSAMQSATSAFRSAMQIVNGDGNKRAFYDVAMEGLKEKVGAQLGEMQQFMTISQDFTKTFDLQNNVYDEQALKRLEEWSKSDKSSLLGTEKAVIVSRSQEPLKIGGQGKADDKDNSFRKLFD